MSILSAVLKGEDNLSSVFDKIANSGAKAVSQWQNAGSVANAAFTAAKDGADVASKAMTTASTSADSLKTSTSGVAGAFKDSVSGTNLATESLKSAMEETEKFKQATADLETQLQELQNAYIGTAMQKGKNSEEAKALQSEINSLSKTLNQNKREFEDLKQASRGVGPAGADSISMIHKALVAAGIAKLIATITSNVRAMSNEFSNAEAVIVRSTGATGAALRDFQSSMFSVYATARSNDLSLVAAAIGEVSTRIGAQGRELESLTRLYMDFADMTGANVVGSIQTVSQVMNRWSMDSSQTEFVLDSLTLAGQATGISVDSLTYSLLQNQATLKALGFDVTESIALFAVFEKGGINAQAAMYGFRRAVTYFSKEGRDAGEALREVIDEIYNLRNDADATALAVETFGVRAGPEMAFAIRQGTFEIDEMIAKLSQAGGTLSRTAANATTLQQRWTQASNQMSAAFSGALSPSINSVSGAFADLKLSVGEFLEEHPVLVSAITGLGVGLGALAIGVTAVAVAKSAAIPKLKAFGVALKVAMGPIGWIAGAIAGLVAIGTAIATAVSNANREFRELTATSKLQYEEIRRLSREHQRATLIYGETSDAAQTLAGELEAARLVFEQSRMTIEEFTEQNERLISQNARVLDSFHDNIAAINEENRSAMNLIGRLGHLSSQTSRTAAEQQQMSAIVDRLNSQFPELTLAIDEQTGALNNSVDAIRALAQAEADRQRMAVQHQTFVDALNQELALREQLLVAAAEYAAAQQRVNEANSFWQRANPFDWDYSRAKNELADFRSEYERLQAALAENLQLQSDTVAAWEAHGRAIDYTANALVSYEEAITRAVRLISYDLERMAADHDRAFAATRDSIGQTLGTFDRVIVGARSVRNSMAALESQTVYFIRHYENIRTAMAMGFDESFINALVDPTQDNVSRLNSIIGDIEKLGDSPYEVAARVDEWNTLWDDLGQAQDNLANLAHGIQSGVFSELDYFEEQMLEFIGGLNMEDEARAAGNALVASYFDGIRSAVGKTDSLELAVTDISAILLGGLATLTSDIDDIGAQIRGFVDNLNIDLSDLTINPGITIEGLDEIEAELHGFVYGLGLSEEAKDAGLALIGGFFEGLEGALQYAEYPEAAIAEMTAALFEELKAAFGEEANLLETAISTMTDGLLDSLVINPGVTFEGLGEIETELREFVYGLDLSEESREAGLAIIDSFFAGFEEAINAAESPEAAIAEMTAGLFNELASAFGEEVYGLEYAIGQMTDGLLDSITLNPYVTFEGLGEIETELREFVYGLDLSEESKEAGLALIDGFFEGITDALASAYDVETALADMIAELFGGLSAVFGGEVYSFNTALEDMAASLIENIVVTPHVIPKVDTPTFEIDTSIERTGGGGQFSGEGAFGRDSASDSEPSFNEYSVYELYKEAWPERVRIYREMAEMHRDVLAELASEVTPEEFDAFAEELRALRLAHSHLPETFELPGFAGGTTNAPYAFIAGEEGPELIVGAAGSTVFTADETRSIFEPITSYTPEINIPEPSPLDIDEPDEGRQSENRSETNKRVRLELFGEGSINVNGNIDEDSVWGLVEPRLKEAFFGILREEVYEEGVISHAF